MKDILALLQDWPYAVWALGAASAFFYVVGVGSKHLSEDAKAALSLYLQGDYQGTWAENFCALFDHIFGPKHLSWTCLWRSAIASLLAVAALYVLLDQILGVLTVRAASALPLWQALLIGAAVNILPDYLSLWETRIVLRVFRKVRNPLLQLVILALDVVLSGLIIWAGITAFLWLTGADPISGVEMVALFSTYAVFFYSTFLTSLWAWLYCLSSWFIKGFTALRLHHLLAVDKAPGTSLALTGSIVVFLGALALKPVITMDETGRVALDDRLCALFPAEACPHVARLTADPEVGLPFGGLQRRRDGGMFGHLQLYEVEPEEAVTLWTISCDDGDVGCTNLGIMYETGRGVDPDDARAVELYRQGCDGGRPVAAATLGSCRDRAWR